MVVVVVVVVVVVIEVTGFYRLVSRAVQDERLGAEQDQLLFGSMETSSGNRQVQKLARFGHVTRHDSLSKTIPQCALEGSRRCGRQRKCWMDDIREWTSLPPAEKTGRGSLLNRLSCPSDDPIGKETELD